MRFGYYKMINDMAVTLKDALGHVKKTGDNSMLGVCIQSLQAIIKALAPCSEDIKSLAVIENLNSMIALLSSHQPDIDKAVSLAEKLISDCRTGLNYKIKVLFVAELGGKWDSMESVYEECMKRYDIEVDVVLQPVFREVRLPDGSVRHEEANYDWLTPMGIKHIPYKQYDMKKILPDITFFSQPYDGCTDPMFWPENMAKYTRVVYLPYYAAFSLHKESPAMESFFKLPTEKYSWRIACQSDKMKKYYELYASRKGENTVVTGIPKWDRPIRINKDNTLCPEEWEKKIKGRKVFLLNTHFNLSVKNNEPFYYERKLIEIFLNRKNDAALIWRPHPMTETVIRTYNPELMPVYEQIIKSVEESSNIVIDKHEDYSYSFVWSDALVSLSRSSVIFQYLLMDKPVVTFIKRDEESAYKIFYTYDKLLEKPLKNITNNVFDIENVGQFVDDIVNRKDEGAAERELLRETFFKYADGRVAERLTERLVEDFLKENGFEQEEKSTAYEHTFLLIGTEEDSKVCSDKLEAENADHCICTDILSGKIKTKDDRGINLSADLKDTFEYFVITSKDDSEMINEIITSLYGVPKERVIPLRKMLFALSDGMVCDRAINSKCEVYGGIILGSSNSYYGLLEEKLDGDWCDLSVPHQDIYFMKKSLEYCLKNAPDKFRKLKYAVIDLQDTFFFNYDVSTSEDFFDYISKGGFMLDSHNYGKNRYFKASFDEIVMAADNEKKKGISDDVLRVGKKYFEGIGCCFKEDEGNLKMITEKEANGPYYIPPHAPVPFEKTIKENLGSFFDILDMLKKVSPDIKIYTTMIPKFMKSDQEMIDVIREHIIYLRDIIQQAEKTYGAVHIDLDAVSDISVARCCYRTYENLNKLGADIMTGILNRSIKNKMPKSV